MTATNPPKNRTGLILALILFVVLIIAVTVVVKLLYPDEPSGTESGEPGTSSTGVVVFQSYYIEPERVNAGDCATLHWTVENADDIELLRDGSVVVDQAKASDSYRDCPDQAAVYKYRLEASNSENANWIELQLIVDE